MAQQLAQVAAPDPGAILKVLNGEHYVPNDVGEAAIKNPNYVVTIKFPNDSKPNFVQSYTQMLLFAHEVNGQVKHDGSTPSDTEKKIIWALRALAWKNGDFDAPSAGELANLQYTEIVHDAAISSALVTEEVRSRFDVAAADIADESKYVQGNYKAGKAFEDASFNWVDFDYLRSIAKQYRNVRALVAYVFRARGHHFKPDFADRFATLWTKNSNAPSNLITKFDGHWDVIATNALHAIPPARLDDAWVSDANDGNICAPYALRINVPCAGTAFYFALYAGIKEACMLAPKLKVENAELIENLTNHVKHLRQNRWEGGINRRFYGAGPDSQREGDYSVLAAVVNGFNTAGDDKTDLGKSNSLDRVAKAAEITRRLARSAATGVYACIEDVQVQRTTGSRILATTMFMDSGGDGVGT